MSNSNEPRALVIVWQGKEVPDEVVAQIVAMMAQCKATIPELVTAKQFDADGLAKCIGNTIHVDGSDILNNKDLDPIYNAIVFIGTKYEECLGNTNKFSIHLSSDLSDEKYKRTTGKPADEGLISAVEILATKTISSKYATVLSEYGIKKNILEVIYNTYMYYNHVFVS